MCDDFPCVSDNISCVCKAVQAPLPRTCTSLAHTGTAAACGEPKCCQPLRFTAAPGRVVPQGSWIQLCLHWPGHYGGFWGCWGMFGPSFWPLLAGEALACSNDLCAPFVLIAPLNPAVFKGCSDGVGSPVCCLSSSSVLSPQPWGPAQQRGKGDRLWQNPLIAATRSQPLVSELSLPPTGGQSLSCPAAWCDKVPANGTGQPLQSPPSPLPHGAAGVNKHPSTPHPPTPTPSLPWPPVCPSQPWIRPDCLSSGV